MFEVIVNGEARKTGRPVIGYDEAVAMAFGTPPRGHVFTVTFSKAKGEPKRQADGEDAPEIVRTEGSLVPNDPRPIVVQDGTVINVADTSNA